MTDHIFSPGNVKSAMAAAGGVKDNLWKVPREAIHRIPGFNPRTLNDAYRTAMRDYADSLIANGWYPDKPAAGYAGDDGKLYLTDAYTRLDAYDLARSEGAELGPIPFVIKVKGTSEEDLWVAVQAGNNGRPLSPYEQAILCKRMAANGRDGAYIARRMGFASAQYVDGLLMLIAAPLPMRRAVEEGVTSATNAISLLRKHGAKAVDVLTAALTATPGKRVTAKSTAAPAPAKGLVKYVEPMYNMLGEVAADDNYALLAPETREAIEALLAQGVTK